VVLGGKSFPTDGSIPDFSKNSTGYIEGPAFETALSQRPGKKKFPFPGRSLGGLGDPKGGALPFYKRAPKERKEGFKLPGEEITIGQRGILEELFEKRGSWKGRGLPLAKGLRGGDLGSLWEVGIQIPEKYWGKKPTQGEKGGREGPGKYLGRMKRTASEVRILEKMASQEGPPGKRICKTRKKGR